MPQDAQPPGLPMEIRLALARAASARDPASVDAAAHLGELLLEAGRLDELRGLLAHDATADGPAGLAVALARRRVSAGDPAGALAVLEGARPGDGVELARGLALTRLGRFEAAADAFLAELRARDDAHEACEALFKLALRAGGPAALPAAHARLPDAYGRTPVGRGYGALALSVEGRAAEARAALDPFAHVEHRRLPTPEGFGGRDAFHARLLAEIAASPGLHRGRKERFRKTETPGGPAEPALRALLAACREAIDGYVAALRAAGALDLLPPLPRPGRVTAQANLVEPGQPHAAHVHKYAAVSGVYYVAVPEAEQGGAIVLGALDGLLEGHAPAWPVRRIRPAPGDVLLFPPHLFHAVEATTSPEVRAAVAFDLVA